MSMLLMQELPEIRSVVKIQPYCMVKVILVAGISLLQDSHVAYVKAEVGADLLFYADKNPVLVEGIVHHFFSKLQHQFIGQRKGGKVFVFEQGDGETREIPDPVGKKRNSPENLSSAIFSCQRCSFLSRCKTVILPIFEITCNCSWIRFSSE